MDVPASASYVIDTKEMIMNKQVFLFSAAALLVCISGASPAQADPPPWAPAHGYRAKQAHEYQYVYYPAQQVYYAPASQTWFWLNGGNWQVGVNLPGRIQLHASSGVPVVLHSDRPYVEHVYVEQYYGRPWREEHEGEHDGNHGNRHGHGHGDHDDD